MIHIENINITVNAQALSDESEIPPRTLDIELLTSLINNFNAEDDEAEEAEPEKQEEVQPPINPARLHSLQQQALQQQANAWKVVCSTLNEVCPGWCTGEGSATYQAAAAIHAMAKAR